MSKYLFTHDGRLRPAPAAVAASLAITSYLALLWLFWLAADLWSVAFLAVCFVCTLVIWSVTIAGKDGA
jgi:hypothetical protein